LDCLVSTDPRTVPLPTGLVTFLMTDIVGSTMLFRRIGDARYAAVLDTQRRLVRAAIARHGGAEVGTEGDSMLAAFDNPERAVRAAVDGQRSLTRHDWPVGESLEVRMGLHIGQASLADERQYVAFALHQAARVTDAARGGQILASQTVADLVRAIDDISLTPTGSFWLKDFPEPVPLVAITAANSTAVLGAPRAPRADLSNLPALRGPFIGRDGDLADLAATLDEPAMLTIIGPGGVGKTRLALEVAARRASNGTEAWVVELAGVTARDDEASESNGSEQAVVTAIAHTLGTDATTAAELTRALTGSSMVLVIDNAEHLLAAVADVVRSLLAGCANLRLIVTSRAPLGIADETLYRLGPLAMPDPAAADDEIDDSPAVALFAARAKAADRDFTLTDTNRGDVVALCAMLDGLPLALELAAARISILAPQALLERVRAVGDLPGLTGRGRPNRHATLHTVLDWSLSLCDDVELAVLRRLAIFAGPVELDAITAVCGGDLLRPASLVDSLVGLVDKSLAVSRRTDPPTYDLLVTIRQAALSRLLAAAERDEAVHRHAGWVLESAIAAAPGGLERDGARIAALSLEIDQALERGLTGEIDRGLYLMMFLALRDHFFTRQQPLGIRHGLHLAGLDIDDTSRAHCLNIAAKAMLELRHPDFIPTTHEALAVSRRSGDPEALGRSLLAIAEIDLLSGPHLSDEGRAALIESMPLMEQVAETSPRSKLHLLVARGWVALDDGDFAAATRWYAECLETSRRLESAFIEAASHFNLAEAAELSGDTERAVEEYRLAASTSLALDGFVSAADALVKATRLLTLSGDGAADCAAEAVLAARRARSDELLRTALLAQADAAAAAGDEYGAQRARHEAGSIPTAAGDKSARAV
jgi:predicted ATPase/class 3 adenylate cyclase